MKLRGLLPFVLFVFYIWHFFAFCCVLFLHTYHITFSSRGLTHHVTGFDQWKQPFMRSRGGNAAGKKICSSSTWGISKPLAAVFNSFAVMGWFCLLTKCSLCLAATRSKRRWPLRGFIFVAGFLKFRYVKRNMLIKFYLQSFNLFISSYEKLTTWV